MLRRNGDSVLRVALHLYVSGKRKRGRLKNTWKKHVEEETEKIGLKEDALDRAKVEKWSASNCRRNEVNLPISVKGTTPNKI